MQKIQKFIKQAGGKQKTAIKYFEISCKFKQKREHRLPLICNTIVSFLFPVSDVQVLISSFGCLVSNTHFLMSRLYKYPVSDVRFLIFSF